MSRATFIVDSWLDGFPLADDDDAFGRPHEALAVTVGVHADLGAGRYLDVLVDDGSLDHRAGTDDDVVHDDRILNDGPAIDHHTWEKD